MTIFWGTSKPTDKLALLLIHEPSPTRAMRGKNPVPRISTRQECGRWGAGSTVCHVYGDVGVMWIALNLIALVGRMQSCALQCAPV